QHRLAISPFSSKKKKVKGQRFFLRTAPVDGKSSGPREDATRIGSAGVVRRQAVDISPLRRVNQAIYLLTTGARESAFTNIKTIAECLADELINAAKGSSNSYAIKKKDEIERVAKANR
ncbi:40S ribosomal protein S5-like, partial [Asparagus officinalis]|uniref:40S ribosomal protein S5-like n=1 Tax=Asparagus officinalis TaxID=4686 RepID=UPI00098E3499